MLKINETYKHEGTGITFSVEFEETFNPTTDADTVIKKKVNIASSPNEYRNGNGFVFKHSKPEVITKIGKALLEIGEFCEKL